MWKIEKVVSKGDYNYAVVKAHPNATKHGYVLHHRIVMENHLGRLLNSKEVVHHINHNKKDNRIENLEVMSISEHTRLHQTEVGELWVKLKCPVCNSLFERPRNKTHLSKGGEATTCGRSCGGKLGRARQLNRVTLQMKKAISVNVLAEFVKYKYK